MCLNMIDVINKILIYSAHSLSEYIVTIFIVVMI